MILAAVLLGVIVVFLALFVVFLNLVLLPSISKDKKFNEDPIVSFSERNYIQPQSVDMQISNERAFVFCNCKKNFADKPYKYNPTYTCFLVKSLQNSPNDCKFACIGQGDCTKVCPQEAISIVNGTAVISNMCCGCGKCVNVCPQQIIKLISKDSKPVSVCSNTNLDNLTTCDCRNKTENVVWDDKKDFKIWSSCYKLIKKIKNKSFNKEK